MYKTKPIKQNKFNEKIYTQSNTLFPTVEFDVFWCVENLDSQVCPGVMTLTEVTSSRGTKLECSSALICTKRYIKDINNTATQHGRICFPTLSWTNNTLEQIFVRQEKVNTVGRSQRKHDNTACKNYNSPNCSHLLSSVLLSDRQYIYRMFLFYKFVEFFLISASFISLLRHRSTVKAFDW